MKQTIYWLAGLIVLAVIGWTAIFFLSGKSTVTEVLENKPITPAINVSAISNIVQAREILRQQVNGNFIYKVNWANIAEVDVDGQKMYFGEIDKVSGNGKLDPSPMPLFLANGTLYVPSGYGGNAYDLKDTDWIWRYKDLSFSAFVPVELMTVAMTPQNFQAFRTASGVENVSMHLDKSGKPIKIELKMNGQTRTFSGPFATVDTVNLLTFDENKDMLDYATYQEKFRKLPGNVTEQKSYLSEMGYSISYPFVINNLKVTQLNDGLNSYGFYINDTQYDPDTATLSCFQNDQQQVGPKTGTPDAIAPESQAKLVDWGMKQEYHQDLFSFTGPGYYCQLRTTGIFRPYMFKIAF